MNLNLDLKLDLKTSLSQWWHTLAASMLSGMDGLGIYLEETKLTLVQVRKQLSGIKVTRYATHPFESGRIEELAGVLQKTVSAWTLKSCPVGLAVTPQLSFFRSASLPRAASENLSKVVAYELDRFLPLPPEQLFYDFQVLEETETEIHLMLMAVLRDQVEACLHLVTEAGLCPVSVELAPVAAGKVFVLSGRPLTPAWMLLRLEDGSFDLALFQGTKIKAFIQERNLSNQELSQTILARVDTMAAAQPKTQIVGVYGKFPADFRVGVFKKHELEVIFPSQIPGLDPDMNLDEVLPALGAGLSCVGQAPLGVNLLPQAERAAIWLGRFSFTTILFSVLLGLGCLWGVSALIHTRVQLYQIDRQIIKLTSEAKQVEGLLQESRSLAKQMESIRKIGESPGKLMVLRELTKLIPQNTWLLNLRLSKESVNLSGISASASDLIPLLDKSVLLKKTEFASPIVTDANKLEHFKIKAEFKGLEPLP